MSHDRSQSGRRYPARCVTFARELRARGYSLPKIREAFARQGFPSPSLNTLAKWTNEDTWERRVEENREYRRRRKERQERERLDCLMADLRHKGLSCAAVSVAVEHFKGARVAAESVRQRTRRFGPFTQPTATTQNALPAGNLKPGKRLPRAKREETLALVQLGLSDGQIASRLGLTRQAVAARRRNLLRELAA